ncbi:DNA-processing protein DprA [Pseudoteredinibacter isoporae]|uniref:DNA-processing protein DprA n=1 Tax=Pseudoteredinibacter isoporae TaxID=570281 RepID=UPI00310B2333
MELDSERESRLALLMCQHWQGRYLRRSLQGLESACQFFALPVNEQRQRLASDAYEQLLPYIQKREHSLLGSQIQNTLERCRTLGVSLLFSSDDEFPSLLKETADPPELLFVSGCLEVLHWPQLAIVGSRKASPSGIKQAEQIAADLASVGLAISSGLALGIDAAAHRGCLRAGGRTVAVLGSGLDRLYPKRHLQLSQQIITEGGVIISEYPFGMPPLPANFPKRNRIVTGMALGTLVVEAAERSGSLISASLALEENREVFAIPGSINNPLSRGCHKLIKQGAILVESAKDIAEQLSSTIQGQLALLPAREETDDESVQEAHSEQAGLLRHVGFDPISLDEIQIASGLTAEEISVQLMELEISGLICQQAGLYQRIK